MDEAKQKLFNEFICSLIEKMYEFSQEKELTEREVVTLAVNFLANIAMQVQKPPAKQIHDLNVKGLSEKEAKEIVSCIGISKSSILGEEAKNLFFDFWEQATKNNEEETEK